VDAAVRLLEGALVGDSVGLSLGEAEVSANCNDGE